MYREGRQERAKSDTGRDQEPVSCDTALERDMMPLFVHEMRSLASDLCLWVGDNGLDIALAQLLVESDNGGLSADRTVP